MPKEIGLNLNFSSNIKAKVQEIEGELKKIADKKLATATEKSVTRTQFAAMDNAMKMYGPGGKSTFSGYKPKGFDGRGTSAIDWISTGGKKPMYEIDEMMPKKRGSGGLMGALGLGAVAGAAAAGTLMLVTALKESLKQTKIGNAFLKTLSTLFSVLVDLILLPFLPILIWGLLGLTNAILKATIAWGKLNPGTPQGAGASVTLGPAALAQSLFGDLGRDIGRWIGENFTDPIIQAVIDWAAGVPAWWDANVAQPFNNGVKTVQDWAAGVPAWWKTNIEDPFYSGLKTITDWANGASNWWETNIAKPFRDGLKTITDWAAGVSAWWKTNIAAPFYSAFKGFINALIGGINAVKGWLRGIPIIGNYAGADIPYLAEGGTIAQTGVAVVHKGETVVPAGQSGGNTFNFPNYVGSKSDLIKIVNDAMRQQGARYMS